MTRRAAAAFAVAEIRQGAGQRRMRRGIFMVREINITTYNLCHINMFPAPISTTKSSILRWAIRCWHRSTRTTSLSSASFPIRPIRSNGRAMRIRCSSTTRVSPRPGILAPKSKADLALRCTCFRGWPRTAPAAIVEFPGVLYRGGAGKRFANT